MDLSVRLITPGSQLSTDTLFRAIRSLEAIVREATLDTLDEFFAAQDIHVERSELGRRLKAAEKATHSGFRLIDARRGSWELMVQTAVGGAIALVVVEVMKELIKRHPGTKRLSDWLNEKTWTPCAEKTAKAIQETQHFGHLGKEYAKVEIESDGIGAYRVNIELRLNRRELPMIAENTQAQMRALMPTLAKKSQNKNKRNRNRPTGGGQT